MGSELRCLGGGGAATGPELSSIGWRFGGEEGLIDKSAKDVTIISFLQGKTSLPIGKLTPESPNPASNHNIDLTPKPNPARLPSQ